MIKLATLPQKAIDALTERLADEYSAYYFYISAAAWARLNGFENIAKYFQIESHGEEYHYKTIVKYLSDWNVSVKFPTIEAPIQTFTGLQDIMDQQYKMELGLLAKYEQDAIIIFSVCQNAFILLQQFISIQNDAIIEVSNYAKKLQAYLDTDPGLMLFDKEVFGQYEYYY